MTLLDVAKPQLIDFVLKAKDEFMARFGDWVHSAHAAELEDIFVQCGTARVEMLCALSHDDVRDWSEIYATNILRLETIGFEVQFVGKIQARQFLADEISQVFSYVPMVLGILAKVGAQFIPGVGTLAAPIIGAGVEYFLDKLMGVGK